MEEVVSVSQRHLFRLIFSYRPTLQRNTLFDLCSAWLNCIGPSWCWGVIKAVRLYLSRRQAVPECLLRYNRSVWCWILITLQCKPEELSDLYSAANTSVCADANITGTFPDFFEVHYKLLQCILQNLDAGGLLSEWSFVRVVFCPYTAINICSLSIKKKNYIFISHIKMST